MPRSVSGHFSRSISIDSYNLRRSRKARKGIVVGSSKNDKRVTKLQAKIQRQEARKVEETEKHKLKVWVGRRGGDEGAVEADIALIAFYTLQYRHNR